MQGMIESSDVNIRYHSLDFVKDIIIDILTPVCSVPIIAADLPIPSYLQIPEVVAVPSPEHLPEDQTCSWVDIGVNSDQLDTILDLASGKFDRGLAYSDMAKVFGVVDCFRRDAAAVGSAGILAVDEVIAGMREDCTRGSQHAAKTAEAETTSGFGAGSCRID